PLLRGRRPHRPRRPRRRRHRDRASGRARGPAPGHPTGLPRPGAGDRPSRGAVRPAAPGCRRDDPGHPRRGEPMTTAPVVARTRDELTAARADLTGGDVAVVMTMGALHEGHSRLIRTARERAEHVLVTIFLNPLQFGPGEDLSKYPRTFDDDLEICTSEGVDLVFAPTPDVVYPDGDPGVRISRSE